MFAPGGLEVAASTIKDVERLAEVVRTGGGMGWGEHHESLFRGTERLFKANYVGSLLSDWLPALDGVVAKLERGARAADRYRIGPVNGPDQRPRRRRLPPVIRLEMFRTGVGRLGD